MMRFLLPAFAALALPAAADAPNVVTDIPPVHSLVARIMEGAGTPGLVMPPGADPHHHAMRPSEAAALEKADIVVWIGEALTPWLSEAMTSLAPDARQIGLLDVEGTTLLEAREQDDDHDHDGAHDHGPVDPHAWLDPVNAKVWLVVIADALAEADPDNAALYRANRDAALAETVAIEAAMSEALLSLAGRPFAVYHDALGYLEARFGLDAAFALTDSEAVDPSPRRIARMRELVADKDVSLLFAEPGWSEGLVATVFEGRDATVCGIDPLGSRQTLGANLYWETLRAVSETMAGCRAE